ncbi:hypothetical protein ScPMuIL_007919 [Solemya velum]
MYLYFSVYLWKRVRTWNQQQIKAWLDKHKFHKRECTNLRPKDIIFLANMKDQAPDTYYKTLCTLFDADDKTLTVQDMADFTEALEEIS